ncbi:MAG: hypothetical protein ACK559_02265, partial [bacterium]
GNSGRGRHSIETVHPVDGSVSRALQRRPADTSSSQQMQSKMIFHWLENPGSPLGVNCDQRGVSELERAWRA